MKHYLRHRKYQLIIQVRKNNIQVLRFFSSIMYHKIISLANILDIRNLTKAGIGNVFGAAKSTLFLMEKLIKFNYKKKLQNYKTFAKLKCFKSFTTTYF